jgi:hypothetical protein
MVRITIFFEEMMPEYFMSNKQKIEKHIFNCWSDVGWAKINSQKPGNSGQRQVMKTLRFCDRSNPFQKLNESFGCSSNVSRFSIFLNHTK